MRNPVQVLCFIVILDLTVAMKVRERYLQYKSPGFRCLIGESDRIARLKDLIGERLIQPWIDSAHYALRHLNCTYVSMDMTFYSLPTDENATYDGYVGHIHRNEVDIGLFIVRPDCLPYEPGKPGPTVLPADVSIITSTEEPKELNYDLTKFLDLGAIMYAYLFSCIYFMVPLIFTYTETARDSRHISSVLVKGYLKNCNNMFNVIVDQEQFSPSTLAGHLIALAASLFTLFAIHGILLNTVGADLVVMNQPATIDSLDDLLSSPLRPMILDNLFVYHILESSNPTQKANKLWLRVNEQKDKSLVKLDSANTVAMLLQAQDIIDVVAGRRAAFVGPDFVSYAIIGLTCIFSGAAIGDIQRLARTVHLSRKGFSQGIFTPLMSHKIHPYTEKILNSVMTTVLETGQAIGVVQMVKYELPAISQMPNVKYNSTTIQCLDKSSQTDQGFEQFTLNKMKKLFLILPSLFVLAFYILVFERFFEPEKPKSTHTRKRPRPRSAPEYGARRRFV